MWAAVEFPPSTSSVLTDRGIDKSSFLSPSVTSTYLAARDVCLLHRRNVYQVAVQVFMPLSERVMCHHSSSTCLTWRSQHDGRSPLSLALMEAREDIADLIISVEETDVNKTDKMVRVPRCFGGQNKYQTSSYYNSRSMRFHSVSRARKVLGLNFCLCERRTEGCFSGIVLATWQVTPYLL